MSYACGSRDTIFCHPACQRKGNQSCRAGTFFFNSMRLNEIFLSDLDSNSFVETNAECMSDNGVPSLMYCHCFVFSVAHIAARRSLYPGCYTCSPCASL